MNKDNLIKYGVQSLAIMVAGFFIAPFVFQAIGGIIGLGVAAGLAGAMVYFSPWMAMKAANLRLKAMKAEAIKNPVETLQIQLVTAQGEVEKSRRELVDFDAALRTFRDEVNGLAKSFPGSEEKFKEQLEEMERGLQAKRDLRNAAIQAMGEFEKVVQRAEAEWRVTQAMINAGKASKSSVDLAVQKILGNTALTSVQNGMNRALADLKTLNLAAPPVIDLPRPSLDFRQSEQVFIPATPTKKELRV